MLSSMVKENLSPADNPEHLQRLIDVELSRKAEETGHAWMNLPDEARTQVILFTSEGGFQEARAVGACPALQEFLVMYVETGKPVFRRQFMGGFVRQLNEQRKQGLENQLEEELSRTRDVRKRLEAQSRISGLARGVALSVAAGLGIGIAAVLGKVAVDKLLEKKVPDPALVKPDDAPRNAKPHWFSDVPAPIRRTPDTAIDLQEDEEFKRVNDQVTRALKSMDSRLKAERMRKQSASIELVGIAPHELTEAGIGFLCGKIVVEGKDGKRKVLDHEKVFPTMFTRDPATQKARVGRGETGYELWQQREEWERAHKDDVRIHTTPDAIQALAERNVTVAIKGKALTVQQQNPMLGRSINEPLYGVRHGTAVMNPKDGTVSILMKGENIECHEGGGIHIIVITKDGLVHETNIPRTQKLDDEDPVRVGGITQVKE